MSKAILIIDMPEHCYECPLENSKRCPFLWEDVESLDKPKNCPLKPYKEAIPIEWIKQWSEQFYKDINGRVYYMGDGYDTIWDLLEDWEKENERR